MLPFLLPLSVSAGWPLGAPHRAILVRHLIHGSVDFPQRFSLHVLIPLLLPDQVQDKKDKDGHESVGGD